MNLIQRHYLELSWGLWTTQLCCISCIGAYWSLKKDNIKHQYSMDGIPLDNVSEEKIWALQLQNLFSQINSVTLLLQSEQNSWDY